MDEKMNKPWFEQKIKVRRKVFRCPDSANCSFESRKGARCVHRYDHYETSACKTGDSSGRCPACEWVGTVETIPGKKMKEFRSEVF